MKKILLIGIATLCCLNVANAKSTATYTIDLGTGTAALTPKITADNCITTDVKNTGSTLNLTITSYDSSDGYSRPAGCETCTHNCWSTMINLTDQSGKNVAYLTFDHSAAKALGATDDRYRTRPSGYVEHGKTNFTVTKIK